MRERCLHLWPKTVAIALLSSLVLSIFVIPVLCSMFLKPQPEKESVILKYVKKIYLPALKFSMQRKFSVLITAGVFLFASIIIIPRLGTEFIPIMDEGAFDMDFQLLPGVSLDKALEINKLIEEKLKKIR